MRNISCSPKTIIFTILLFTLFFISSNKSLAVQFVVNNLNDAGTGSLRQAILDANGSAGADEIVFQDGLTGTITLSTGEMAITDDLTITGPGAGVITIDANNTSRIFNIDNGDSGTSITVSISGLHLHREFG